MLQAHPQGIFFGALAAELHTVLVSGRRVYRQEAKDLLARLLTAIRLLPIEEIVIDRLKHCERVRLQSPCAC